MRIPRIGIVCLAALLGVAACRGSSGESDGEGGGGGDGGGGQTEPPVEPPRLGLGTPVGLNPMAYGLPGVTSCLRRTGEVALQAAPAGFALDGLLEEWAAVQAYPDDPAGDAPPAVDLARAAFARSGNDLVLAVGTAVDAGAAGSIVSIELGGVLARRGTLAAEVRRRFRIQADVLAESVDGGATWEPVAEAQGRFARGAGGIEVWLSERLLGDVVTWPIWWARVHAAASAAPGAASDSTPAAYFASMLGADGLPFTVSSCTHWSGRRIPFSFVDVQDARATLVAGGYPAAMAERGFQLVRYGFDAALDTLGDVRLPLTRLPVIATTHKLPPELRRDDPFDPASRDGWPYRGLVVDLRPLASDATAGFPHGPVVERSAQAFFELYLRGVQPAAPVHLVRAVAIALRGHVARREMGLSYVLDYGRDRITPLLAASDLTAPEPLARRAARLADPAGFASPAERERHLVATLAKIEAFGHLLGGYFSSAELVAAWNGAASEPAFLRALEAAATSDRGRGAVAKLARGWLLEGAYDAQHGPGAFGDTDHDGLMDIDELLAGTSPLKADTDGDAWSDAAELVAGTDPASAASAPDRLMPDGLFDDWLELLPKKINLDKGRSGRCPVAADVTHYAAVAGRDDLMIGAMAADFWQDEPRAKWEATIDFPALNRQFLVTAASGSHEYHLKDPKSGRVIRTFQRGWQMGRTTIEWALNRRHLGVDAPFTAADAVRIRLRTVFRDGEEDRFCDETSWFSPAVSN